MFWLNYFFMVKLYVTSIIFSVILELSSTMESKLSGLLKDTTHLSVVSKLIVIVSSKVLDVFLCPDMNEKFLTGTLSHSTITTRGGDKFHTPTLPSRVRLSTTEQLTPKLYSDSVFAFSASKLYLNFSFGVLIPHHHLCSACANPEGTGVWTRPHEK